MVISVKGLLQRLLDDSRPEGGKGRGCGLDGDSLLAKTEFGVAPGFLEKSKRQKVKFTLDKATVGLGQWFTARTEVCVAGNTILPRVHISTCLLTIFFCNCTTVEAVA